MKPHKLNLEDLVWEPFAHGRFGSLDKPLSGKLAAERLDSVLTRLDPGQVSCPFHFHHASEELFYVLSGTGRLRFGDREQPIGAGDFISCPPGPESAHQIVNDGTEPLVYLAVSTVEPIDVCEYPDSDKVMISVAPRDGRPGFWGVFPKAARVDYWHGEA